MTDDHGVDGAAYVMAQDGEYDPALFCSCGFVARGETWKLAGDEMDEHLEESEARGGR